MAEEAGTCRSSRNRPARHPRRPYDTICFEAQKTESGKDRFNEREDRIPPFLATWRNNLTALSQYHNLYFVACSTKIHVFEPTPPGQTIQSEPTIIITPKLKYPSASGYISSRVPNAINRILVDDLGRDEILLLATDSGNVTGYRTQHIWRTVQDAKAERRKALEAGRKPPPRDAEVDTFFLESVGMSAWGLAIHKYARLIAVSSNTREISVFAFALVDETTISKNGEEDPLEMGEDLNLQSQDWVTIAYSKDFLELALLMPDRHRSRNFKMILKGHLTNIPNISFLNSDLDLEGNWLVSTDIDNRLLVWNIWRQMSPVNHFDFTEPGPEHRGWNVLALDIRNFRLAETPEEACGGRPAQMEDRSRADLETTHLIGSIPDVSDAYTYFPPEDLDDGHVSEGSFDPGDPVSITNDEGVVEYVDDSRKSGHSNLFPSNIVKYSSSQDASRDEPQNNTADTATEIRAWHGGSTAEHESPADSAAAPGADANDMEAEEELPQAASSGLTSQTEDEGPGPSGNELIPVSAAPIGGHPGWQVDDGTAPMNTATFLQLVMQDAFGGEISGLEDEDEDNESNEGSGDEEMTGTSEPVESDQGPDTESEDLGAHAEDDEDDESDYNDDDEDMESDDEDANDQRALYNIFNALVREHAFQDSIEESDAVHGQQQPSNPTQPFLQFPILHFSDTDIRLLTNPFSVRPSLFSREPFRQPFSVPILSIQACDRINMVHSVPELGIVIAATQKGRVAVITLTYVKSEGLPYFRVDWIAPFESQERFGERPLCPLVGIAVGPVASQLFQYPSDEELNSHVEINLKSQLHSISMGTDNESGTKEAGHDPESPEDDDSKGKGKQPDRPVQNHYRGINLNYPTNRHQEPWHANLEYSRRYRLMMYYSDHTIMSYQFYHDWPRRMFSGIPDAYTPEDVILNM